MEKDSSWGHTTDCALDCMLPEAASETGIQVQISNHLASDPRKHQ